MEKKGTKIAYFVALAVVVVALVIAKVTNDGSGFVAHNKSGWYFLKGYSLNGNNKDKLMNEYNNLYGFNLKDKEEDMFKSYIKPKYSDGFKKLNK